MTSVVAERSASGEDAGAPIRVGVLVFPGSNDDRDLARAFRLLGAEVEMVWHKDRRLPDGLSGIGIPGGFSYGDYLRAGSMARFSAVMDAVGDRAESGTPVLGICNGFQILCESGLLPGALVRNRDLLFLSRDVRVRVCEPGRFGAELDAADLLQLPIKHAQGAYVPDPGRKFRVALRYEGDNPNGTTDGIAGVLNEAGNVLGLMPHPEHAVEAGVGPGSTDGALLLRSFLRACAVAARAR